jgi:hypothetical protein
MEKIGRIALDIAEIEPYRSYRRTGAHMSGSSVEAMQGGIDATNASGTTCLTSRVEHHGTRDAHEGDTSRQV